MRDFLGTTRVALMNLLRHVRAGVKVGDIVDVVSRNKFQQSVAAAERHQPAYCENPQPIKVNRLTTCNFYCKYVSKLFSL